MQLNYFQILGICLLILALPCFTFAASQFDVPGPQGTYKFGENVVVLPNGNFVVTSTWYTVPGPTPITQAGAVFLYNGKTRALISQLTGSHNNARIGGSVTVLANGNFVVTGGVRSDTYNDLMGGAMFCNGTTGCNGVMTASRSLVGNKPDDYAAGEVKPLSNGNYLVISSSWDNGAIANAGAVTFCSGTTGCTGVISADNSLIGSNPEDQLGASCDPCPRGIVTMPNGNYLIVNTRWNEMRGAVTFGNGTTGTIGVVSAENSLIGVNPTEKVGYGNPNTIGVTLLTNNNYVVSTVMFNNGRGATTLCSGVSGCQGVVSPANSLVGANAGDGSGNLVVPLANGNYVVATSGYDVSPSIFTVGAVTLCSGTTGRIETVSPQNSLVGGNSNDNIADFGIQALTNGNYVVKSPSWNRNRGAVTFGNGVTGVVGTVSSQNSLVGTRELDRVGERHSAVLTNGNFAVASEKWFGSRGAVTFINGNTGISGEISAANSLVGSVAGDAVGSSIIALTNGNYVVGSQGWDNGAIANTGAATWCEGTTGCTGLISPENSLIGNAGDIVTSSYQGLKALTNGNYVVISDKWNQNRGAVTLGNGQTGTTGIVSASNSLVGQTVGDNVGSEGVVALQNGNYVVNSMMWNNGSAARAGAITWGNGLTGTNGVVSAVNSLVGTTSDDKIGFDSLNQGLGGAVYPLLNGSYVVRSRFWDNGSILNAGAISLGKSNSPITGVISAENSVRGTMSQPSFPGLVFAYDYKNKQLLVGRPDSNAVTIFRYDTPASTMFDFDGDGKSDISVWRASTGSWWYLQSSDLSGHGHSFGLADDIITPGDFTGDGKWDVAIWRPSTGEWFVRRSEDGSYFAYSFGLPGDIPAPADYDGDGITDTSTFRPSTATWYIFNSSSSTYSILTFGLDGDKPVPADYDGDGKADIATWRPSNGTWWIVYSSDFSQRGYGFGQSTDKPVVGGDYTGDGKADIALWRPATSEWYFLRSEDGSYYSYPSGLPGDIPAPGDYDGDGKFDSAVFRPSTVTWYIDGSTAGSMILTFGLNGDRPVANAFVP